MKNISKIRLNNIMLQSELKKKVLKKTEYPFLIICGIYLFELAIDNTMFSLEINDLISMILFFTLSVVVVIRVLAQLNNKFIWYSIPICLIYNMTWDKDYFPIIALITVGCVGISYRKVLKVFIVSIGSTIALTILVALGGGIENIVYLRNGQLRSSLGIIYPTDLAAFVFFIVLVLWVYFNNIKEYLFIPLVLISIWVSTYITQSRTGMICSIGLLCIITYFIFDSYYIDKITRLKCVNRIIDICFQAAFPVCAFGVLFLTWSFSKGYKYAIIANKFMSTRLKIALDAVMDNGITLLGNFFRQEGLGATTYSLQKYTFVDISYLQILLSYGLVTLILYTFLWVFMSKRALRAGDRRLLAALALVAFDSVTEHHFMHLHYNIFLILPFADFSFRDQKKEVGVDHPIRLKTAAFCIVILGLLSSRILSCFRIVIARCNNNQICMIFVAALLAGSIIALVVGLSWLVEEKVKHKEFEKKSVLMTVCSATLLIIITVAVNCIVGLSVKEYSKCIEMEEQSIKVILESKTGRVYVDKIGEIYCRKFNDISRSVFDGEDLARFENTTVLVNKGMDSSIFKGKGYMYSEISDEHAIYSNDNAVLNSLRKNGYKISSFCTTKYIADLNEIAKKNGLKTDEEGNILLGKKSPKMHIDSDFKCLNSVTERNVSLYSGKYTLNYLLSINPLQYDKDYKVCSVMINAYNGEQEIRNLDLYRSWFDEKGNLDARIIFFCESYPNMSFTLTSELNEEIKVKEVGLQRTPDYDVHVEYDDRGRKIRGVYYDIEGNPVINNDGYASVKYGYNKEGMLDTVEYFDLEENPVISKRGYAAIRRYYSYNGKCIRQEYLDLNGNLTNSEDGYAVREWKYDDRGDAFDITFYGTNNKPIRSVYGYAEVKREFDDKHRIIREKYYGTDGQAVILDAGFSGITKCYDKTDELPFKVIFNDYTGMPTENNYGYASVALKYNSDESIAMEEYYDTNNEPIVFPKGYSIRETFYDVSGRKWLYKYYDTYGKQTLYFFPDIKKQTFVGWDDFRDLYMDDEDREQRFDYIPI